MPPTDRDPSGRVGQVLREKWTLERLIGSGGMGAVYAARHRNGARAAVKILHPEMSRRDDVRERFRREGYAANRVAHRAAVQVLDDDVAEDGSAFLVMELLEGASLAGHVERQGGVVETDVLLGWMNEILDCLAAAHDQGIVHRDLKPDNIFILTDGRVKLLDFGLARLSDNASAGFRTATGMIVGTAPYMSPEQALGKWTELDGRSDLFAAGATMFRILARRRIHLVASDAELVSAMATRPAPPLASVAPDVPIDVCALVDRSLAFLPANRYPDARTMQRDLRAVRGGAAPPHAMAMAAQGLRPDATGSAEARPSSQTPTVVDRPAPRVPTDTLPDTGPPTDPDPPNTETPAPFAVPFPLVGANAPQAPACAPPSAPISSAAPTLNEAAPVPRTASPTVSSPSNRPPAKRRRSMALMIGPAVVLSGVAIAIYLLWPSEPVRAPSPTRAVDPTSAPAIPAAAAPRSVVTETPPAPPATAPKTAKPKGKAR